MKSLVDLQISIAREERKYFRNWKRYVNKIKRRVEKKLSKEVKVMVFGSVLRDESIPGKSDIDVLIVDEKCPLSSREQTKLSGELLKGFEDSPFEIHFARPEIFEKWYRKFIGKEVWEV